VKKGFRVRREGERKGKKKEGGKKKVSEEREVGEKSE
jgi:hypothetical protein